MKRLKIAYALILAAMLTGCSSAYFASGGSQSFSDDMYATHDRARIAQQQKEQAELRKAEAAARQAEWEARLAEAKAAAAESSYYASQSENPYRSVLADSYESAYARRLYAFDSPSYNLPSSYWSLRYSPTYNYVSAYDPAFYNVIVMGDNVWVEPKYITSMFGTWGLPTASTAFYAAGLYNRWYYDWGYVPYYSWAWGYPRYSWRFYDPYYSWNFGWGWHGHGYWGYPGWGYPGWGPGFHPHYALGHGHGPAGGNWSRPGQRPGIYSGGYNRGGGAARPSYNVGGNRPASGGNQMNGAANRGSGAASVKRGSTTPAGSSSGTRGSNNGSSGRNSNGGSSSFNRSNSGGSSYNGGNSSTRSSYGGSSSGGGGYTGGGGSRSGGGGGGNGRGR